MADNFEEIARKRLKERVVVVDAEPSNMTFDDMPLAGGVIQRSHDDMFARELKKAENATSAGVSFVAGYGEDEEPVAPEAAASEEMTDAEEIAALPDDEKSNAIKAWRSKYDGERRGIQKDIAALGDPKYTLDTPFGPVTEAQLVKEMGEYKKAIATAQSQMNENMSRIQRAEVMDKVLEALTYLAAGMYGAKTGVDVSGVKYNPLDWSKRFERETDKFKAEMSRLKNEQDIQESMLGRLDKQKAAMRQERQDKLGDLDRQQKLIDDLDNADYKAASLAVQAEASRGGAEARAQTQQERNERERQKQRLGQYNDMQKYVVQASKAKTDEERRSLMGRAKANWKDLGGDDKVFTDLVDDWFFDNAPEPSDIIDRIAEIGIPADRGAAPSRTAAPAAATQKRTFKPGDTAVFEGVTHVRQANGTWLPKQ